MLSRLPSALCPCFAERSKGIGLWRWGTPFRVNVTFKRSSRINVTLTRNGGGGMEVAEWGAGGMGGGDQVMPSISLIGPIAK